MDMSILLYRRNTESLKYCSSLNNSCPPLPPTILLLTPSFLLFLPCEHQRSGTDEWGDSTLELRLSTPQSCTLESKNAGLHIICFIFYFCCCQRNMHKGLNCLNSSSPVLHIGKEQLCSNWFKYAENEHRFTVCFFFSLGLNLALNNSVSCAL